MIVGIAMFKTGAAQIVGRMVIKWSKGSERVFLMVSCAVAGVLAMRPKVIVFDESTAMLDPIGRRDILALAKRLNREEGITVVWITHFMDEAVQADRVVVMDSGRIALEGTPREVFVQVDRVRALGLDVPEMMRLSQDLRAAGVNGLSGQAMTVEEMAEELCRLKSRI